MPLIIVVSAVNYFSEKSSIANVWLAKGLKILNSLLFPVFKLSRENGQLENMCDIIFEMAKGVYAEATLQKVP